MTRLLIKKQLMEIFKSYFYNAKRGKKRSRGGVIASFVFFAAIMAGLLGGIFTMISSSLCGPLTSAGLGWLYFILMSAAAVLLGAFGSVFNTYSGLYLARDNDLLFSLPIPVAAIMVSRLMTVYLMGLMYSACVLVPAMIVYWVSNGPSFMTVLGGLVTLLDVSLIVLCLSCLLGYVVARISLKLKNKGLLTALITVVFLGGYYFFYFRFSDMIQTLVRNAGTYGEKIKGSARMLYLFGTMGEGNGAAMLLWTLVCAALAAAVWLVLERSFLKIATSTGAVTRTVYREKKVRRKSPASALLARELRHFTSSASYMLNCGLGILLLPAAGIALLWKGESVLAIPARVFGVNGTVMLICAGLCLMGTMIDTAAPSVSLEGKNLWIAQSLPVTPWQVIRAKFHTQLLLGGIPTLAAALCGAAVIARQFSVPAGTLVLFVLLPLLFQALLSAWGLFFGVRMAKTDWTNEIYPIKQSMPVFLSLFGGWAMAFAVGAIYLWQMNRFSLPVYMAIVAAIAAGATAGMLFWLKGEGSRRFMELQ